MNGFDILTIIEAYPQILSNSPLLTSPSKMIPWRDLAHSQTTPITSEVQDWGNQPMLQALDFRRFAMILPCLPNIFGDRSFAPTGSMTSDIWKLSASATAKASSMPSKMDWLMVSTELENISQLVWLFRIYEKIKQCSKPPPSGVFLSKSHSWSSAKSSHTSSQCFFLKQNVASDETATRPERRPTRLEDVSTRNIANGGGANYQATSIWWKGWCNANFSDQIIPIYAKLSEV